VVNEREQEAVRFIRERRAAGMSLREIADQLNAAGVLTKKGGKWYASTVKYILENNLYEKEAV
jgi:DNA-binding transcriptional MerR regulator